MLPNTRFTERVFTQCIDKGLTLASQSVKALSMHLFRKSNIEIIRNLSYHSSAIDLNHACDLYVPRSSSNLAEKPVIVYLHGGGFRILSKDSHWMMGLLFAEQAYPVFVLNYSLQPYPHGLQDIALFLAWFHQHHTSYGLSRNIILAGESAGANLSTAVTLAQTYRFEDTFAQQIYEQHPSILGVIAACGMMQVCEPESYQQTQSISRLIQSRIRLISNHYSNQQQTPVLSLANPLCVLESNLSFSKQLPPFFLPVGSRDPILNDTLRMHKALNQRHILNQIKIYPNQGHAFHAVFFTQAAKQCWKDIFDFIKQIELLSQSNANATSVGSGSL